MSGFVPLNAGYTVSVRRTKLNVLVLLTLALAGESPTCILHEGIHTQLAKLSLIKILIGRSHSWRACFHFEDTHVQTYL